MMRVWALAILVLTACSGSGEVRAPADERADVERLQNALTEDPTQLILEEVDQAVATERPAMAAALIENAALPAVRNHIDSVQALDMHTAGGRTFRSRTVRVLRHRETALGHWRDALSRGIGHEDELLLDAIHENAEAEHERFELLQELAIIRPLETRGAHADDPMAGPPALAPPSSDDDDAPQSPDPEPDPHAADPIDGQEGMDPVVPPGWREREEDHHAIVPTPH